MKNKTFKEYVAPILVLFGICLVVTAILAYVNSVTAPIIDENARKLADEVRTQLLPSADSFKEYDGDLVVVEEGKVYVEDCFVAENGSGMVVTVKTKSFGGMLTEMVGIDDKGAITGVKVTKHSDTPGLGTKAHAQEHLKQYIGVTKLAGMGGSTGGGTDSSSGASSDGSSGASMSADSNISAVSGATVSSNGVHAGIAAALTQFQQMGGVPQ